MLFFSRSNKLLYWIAPIKSYYRYIITIVVCTTLFGFWWFCLYTPLYFVDLSYTQENQTMRQHGEQVKQESRSVPSLENTVKELQYALDVYGTKTSYDAQEASANDIVRLVQASGLSLSSYKMEREIDKKVHTKSIIRLSLSGTYEQLVHFFKQIQAQKMLLKGNNISLQATTDPEKYMIACELVSFSLAKKNPST